MSQQYDESQAVILARIDERTRSTQKGMEALSGEVKELKAGLESKFVTQEEFKPVKSIAYGLVKIILTVVVLGLLGLVIISKVKG